MSKSITTEYMVTWTSDSGKMRKTARFPSFAAATLMFEEKLAERKRPKLTRIVHTVEETVLSYRPTPWASPTVDQ